MVRNIVLVRLRQDSDRDAIAALQEELRAMGARHTTDYAIGDDLGLREGNWSFAILATFPDETAYRAYDADGEHNALRARLVEHADAIARVQLSA